MNCGFEFIFDSTFKVNFYYALKMHYKCKRQNASSDDENDMNKGRSNGINNSNSECVSGGNFYLKYIPTAFRNGKILLG